MTKYVYLVRWIGECPDQTYCNVFRDKNDAVNFMISAIDDDCLRKKDLKMTYDERYTFIQENNVYPKSDSENYEYYFQLEKLPLK